MTGIGLFLPELPVVMDILLETKGLLYRAQAALEELVLGEDPVLVNVRSDLDETEIDKVGDDPECRVRNLRFVDDETVTH